MLLFVTDGHDDEDGFYNSEDDQAIIAKYDAGRSERNEILSWEDPALEVYHVTDRYGFIQYVVSLKLIIYKNNN